MIQHVFTYGTLELPAIMQAVTGKRFLSRPVRLVGYSRFLVKDKSYPGICKDGSGCTQGMLYMYVDHASLMLLDDFEAPIYERLSVTVKASDEATYQAYAYIVPSEQKDILSSMPWDKELFLRTHYRTFLSWCKEFYRRP